MVDFYNGVMRSWSNQIMSSPAQTQPSPTARNTAHPSSNERRRRRQRSGRSAPLRFAPVARARATRPSLLTKTSPHLCDPVRSGAVVGSRRCYSSRGSSKSGARGMARSENLDGADEASPVARLASQELSPSITPCPSGPPPTLPPWPPVAGLGISGVVAAPGTVGVGPVGAVVAPGPLDDFRLHVVKRRERQLVKRTPRNLLKPLCY
uniref:Uncharacterized protein n=1 Tax=Arundo donax TaxID=35708 RepID=A0A0A9E2C6_ARUDO